MNKKNLILLIIGLVLVGAIVFYNNQPKNDTGMPSEPLAGDTNPDISTGDTLPENQNPESPSIESMDSGVVSKNDPLFDEALKNGSAEFNKGNYDKAIAYFNDALKYEDAGVVYVRLSSAYSAKGDKAKALEMISKAVELDSFYTDYRVTKLYLMSSMGIAVPELKAVYTDGLDKVNPKTKINLVTSFARIVEEKKDYKYAVSLWQEAQKIYPDNKDIYQAEIDRLNSLSN